MQSRNFLGVRKIRQEQYRRLTDTITQLHYLFICRDHRFAEGIEMVQVQSIEKLHAACDECR